MGIDRRIREEVRANLEKNKIKVVQLDVNGQCNARCWFCPVKYEGNPRETAVNMPMDKVESVIRKIRKSPLCNNKDIIFSNFSEVLLYDDFEGLVRLTKDHGYRTMIYTNGVALTPRVIDVISSNTDVVYKVLLNVPSLDKTSWAIRTGLSEKIHGTLMNNLEYLHDTLGNRIPIDIQMNAATNPVSSKERELYPNMVYTPRDEFKDDVDRMRSTFGAFKVYGSGLIDRCGILSDHGAYKNHRVDELYENEVVNGCSQSSGGVSKIYSLMCINSVGDAFVCCNDFRMDFKFGNVFEQSIEELWLSEKHVDSICKMFSTFCHRCVYRKITNV